MPKAQPRILTFAVKLLGIGAVASGLIAAFVFFAGIGQFLRLLASFILAFLFLCSLQRRRGAHSPGAAPFTLSHFTPPDRAGGHDAGGHDVRGHSVGDHAHCLGGHGGGGHGGGSDGGGGDGGGGD